MSSALVLVMERRVLNVSWACWTMLAFVVDRAHSCASVRAGCSVGVADVVLGRAAVGPGC